MKLDARETKRKQITLRIPNEDYEALKEAASKAGIDLSIYNAPFEQLLQDRGVTVSRLAKATGISRPTLTKMVQGKTGGIQFATLERLCEFFDLSPGELITIMQDKSAHR